MAHQFWISYHPPGGGSRHNAGDETPPIPEEEMEQQKIEHECQLQKEKERHAREEKQDQELEGDLLKQRQIEAEEEYRRECETQSGMHASWSHCDLQPTAGARWCRPRPSVSDSCRSISKQNLRKVGSVASNNNESMLSIAEHDGIFLDLSRQSSHQDDGPYDEESPTPQLQCGSMPVQMKFRERHIVGMLPKAPSCPGAPIASLDCMDEFSANSQQMLDQVARNVSTYMGNHTTMPSVVTPGLRYKNLGKSGLRVPNVGLGLWSVFGPSVPEEISEEMVNVALDSGINLFDLSEAHSAKAELELGKILVKRNVKRASVIIATKIYWSTKSDERGLSRKHVVESVKASIARLQVEYIDIVLLHKVDPMCPMEELVRAMNFVINQGWVMYWGTARWSAPEVMDAYTNCRQFNCVTPIVEQTEYHMFCREKPEIYLPELYHKIGVGLMVWSAITTGKGLGREEVNGLFARSRFNRKYSTFSWCDNEEAQAALAQESREAAQPALLSNGTASNGSKENVGEETRTYAEKLRDLGSLASNLSCSVSQLAIAWCLKNESVNCLLLGAVSVAQLKENIHALQIVPQLSATVMADIERILANKPQRPPMISTLVMRSQQAGLAAAAAAAAANSAVRIDIPGTSGSGATTPKTEAVVAGPSGTAADAKDAIKGFCEVQ